MAYFDGGLHGYNGPNGYVAPLKTTRVYCDDCAESSIPLPATGPNGDRVGRHWATGFKWAPYYGGEDGHCVQCSKAC